MLRRILYILNRVTDSWGFGTGTARQGLKRTESKRGRRSTQSVSAHRLIKEIWPVRENRKTVTRSVGTCDTYQDILRGSSVLLKSPSRPDHLAEATYCSERRPQNGPIQPENQWPRIRVLARWYNNQAAAASVPISAKKGRNKGNRTEIRREEEMWAPTKSKKKS